MAGGGSHGATTRPRQRRRSTVNGRRRRERRAIWRGARIRETEGAYSGAQVQRQWNDDGCWRRRRGRICRARMLSVGRGFNKAEERGARRLEAGQQLRFNLLGKAKERPLARQQHTKSQCPQVAGRRLRRWGRSEEVACEGYVPPANGASLTSLPGSLVSAGSARGKKQNGRNAGTLEH